VGWSPSRLLHELPAALDGICQRFRAIQNNLHIEHMEVGVWVPEPDYLDRLRFQLHHYPSEISADEMFADIEVSYVEAMFEGKCAPPPPAPPDYVTAVRTLREALRESKGSKPSDRLHAALEAFERRLDVDLIQPILQPTAAPRTRNLQAS